MLFNSYLFVLFFLPVTAAGYFLLNRLKRYGLAEVFLLGMSLWFYAYFNVSYLPIMLFSIVFNYGIYRLFGVCGGVGARRKGILLLGIACNLGVLFYFKYYELFVENVKAQFRTEMALAGLLRPLGISFFTFQQLSFVIDAYRGEIPDYSFLRYALFVSFFPQLIAGPIVTHDELVPQFSDMEKRRMDWRNLSQGLFIFSMGLAKKVLVADMFGNAANWGFAHYLELNAPNAWLTILSYTIQIYFDFSGYCDMAIGIGKLLNIDLPVNFHSPYKALTITEFWERWHMTLTRFFTRYVYIPLGGNRKGTARMCLNTMIVFLTSGLWHGANWTFVLWGGVHGAFCVAAKVFADFFKGLHPALNWLVTFSFVNIMWVFFRADSILQALVILKRAVCLNMGAIDANIIQAFQLKEILYLAGKLGLDRLYRDFPQVWMAGCFALALVVLLGKRNSYERMERFSARFSEGALTALLMVWGIFSLSGVSTFLYFNF